MKNIDWTLFAPWIKAIIISIAGFYLAKLSAKIMRRYAEKYATEQQSMIASKVVYSIVIVLFLLDALDQLPLDLTVIIGSAGIVTAALGFASQTSMSNFISGIFLIIEQTFVIGDTITIKGITGKVDSIDLLSVKVRTLENSLVRIPNSMIISNELINLTKFPHRRLDLMLNVSHKDDIDQIKKQLIALAKEQALSLDHPPPSVLVTELSDSSVQLQLSVWVKKLDYIPLKDKLLQAIKLTNIDFPTHHMTVHLVQ